MPKGRDEYEQEVGTYFTEKKEFTKAIQTYALKNVKNLKFVKNNKKIVLVKCLGAEEKCK